MTSYSSNNLLQVISGERLADVHFIIDALRNSNGANSAYSITSTGSTRTGATKLTSVYNQIDSTPSSSGVILPSTAGSPKTPYQYCVVINNGLNSLQVYANGTDTINGTSGATGVSQSSGTAALYISARIGYWFSLSGQGGGGGGISRSINSVSTNTNAAAATGTDYVYLCSGTMTLTLPTAVGNTNRYTIKNTNANSSLGAITIATTSAQTIDLSSSELLYVALSSFDVISDNSNWWII